jgi:hypothetical protein
MGRTAAVLALALVALVTTMVLLAGLTLGTEELDRRQSRRFVRRAAATRLSLEATEKMVAEECARLLTRAG